MNNFNFNNYNSNRANIMKQLSVFFRSKSVLPKLMFVNFAIWIFISFLNVIGYLFNKEGLVFVFTMKYFAIPSNIEILITKPWTIITYMFLHIEFFHILFNMMWLYWFGLIFLEFLSQKKLFFTYILGGISGAVFYVVAYNIFPAFSNTLINSMALGASASVFAIVFAVSFYSPNYVINLLFLGKVKIIYIALVSIVMDVFMISSSNAGGHIAHIGGAFYGLCFALVLKKNFRFDLSALRNILTIFKPEKKFKYKNVSNNKRVFTDDEYNIQRALKQKRMDEILDKISKHGYDKLTKEEKEFLFQVSKKS